MNRSQTREVMLRVVARLCARQVVQDELPGTFLVGVGADGDLNRAGCSTLEVQDDATVAVDLARDDALAVLGLIGRLQQVAALEFRGQLVPVTRRQWLAGQLVGQAAEARHERMAHFLVERDGRRGGTLVGVGTAGQGQGESGNAHSRNKHRIDKVHNFIIQHLYINCKARDL